MPLSVDLEHSVRWLAVRLVGRVGGVVQLCLKSACGSSVSMSSNMTLAGAMLMANGKVLVSGGWDGATYFRSSSGFSFWATPTSGNIS